MKTNVKASTMHVYNNYGSLTLHFRPVKAKKVSKIHLENYTREATRGCGHVRCLRGYGMYTENRTQSLNLQLSKKKEVTNEHL